ncbi:hypothetical protein CFAM422_009914 [Trichoderma lentiforme]|uniref:Uncharacterized protein n=1 Tax=Trichoderma lentiforme TaxID=1567552 RepID=A0A9P4X8C9_9HYPO|nr:hypothetical protein CFAM422_009914 [Trichoderma lentiforme]
MEWHLCAIRLSGTVQRTTANRPSLGPAPNIHASRTGTEPNWAFVTSSWPAGSSPDARRAQAKYLSAVPSPGEYLAPAGALARFPPDNLASNLSRIKTRRLAPGLVAGLVVSRP